MNLRCRVSWLLTRLKISTLYNFGPEYRILFCRRARSAPNKVCLVTIATFFSRIVLLDSGSVLVHWRQIVVVQVVPEVLAMKPLKPQTSVAMVGQRAVIV